jgi:ubiquinone/menaquinone biosynthesis C-methylase UbiE
MTSSRDSGDEFATLIPDALAELHAPLIPILRHVLARAPLPRVGVALDLACGPGLKAPLLAEACGPGVRLVGVDIDYGAIRAATTDHRLPTTDQGQMVSVVRRRSPALSTGAGSVVGVVGNALALPLRDGCCAAAFCIAALGLFADRLVALRELRRALAPGGVALLVVGTQAWAKTIRWPADLAARLAAAYAQALAEGVAPLAASPDLGGDLADLLIGAGFTAPLIRAFSLDHQTLYGGPSVAASLAAELSLLSWPALRPLLAGRLAAAELERCDDRSADSEIELHALALVTQACTRELHPAPTRRSHLLHRSALSYRHHRSSKPTWPYPPGASANKGDRE